MRALSRTGGVSSSRWYTIAGNGDVGQVQLTHGRRVEETDPRERQGECGGGLNVGGAGDSGSDIKPAGRVEGKNRGWLLIGPLDQLTSLSGRIAGQAVANQCVRDQVSRRRPLVVTVPMRARMSAWWAGTGFSESGSDSTTDTEQPRSTRCRAATGPTPPLPPGTGQHGHAGWCEPARASSAKLPPAFPSFGSARCAGNALLEPLRAVISDHHPNNAEYLLARVAWGREYARPNPAFSGVP